MTLIRCYTTRLAIFRLPVRAFSHPIRRRDFANESQPVRYEPEPDYETGAQNVQNEFIGYTASAFRNLGKVLAYTGYGALILGLVTATAFEGGHFWIERQMRVVPNEDAERWGWEVEGWTGGNTGGTSSALGLYGRHAVRAAWFTLHHGSRLGSTGVISQVDGGQAAGSLNLVDSDLESARVYLETGMARVRNQDGRLREDRVGLDLLERHAAVLERIGTRAALVKAREEYFQILDARAGQRLAQARLTVKLGDLSERLGDGEAALTWWARGIDLTKDDVSLEASTTTRASSPSLPSTGVLSALREWTRGMPHNEDGSSSASNETTSSKFIFPNRPPSSPVAQRTLVAAMLSLSAYYSTRKQLAEAKRIQEYAIPLIEAMVPTLDASATSSARRDAQSPGQILHHMYLMHRKSVLAVHHAEVTYSMASPSALPKKSALMGPLTDLLTAASSSELVAQALTQASVSPQDVPSSLSSKPLTATSSKPQSAVLNRDLNPTYRESPWLQAPARSILRDARLTATEAWDLSGVLYGELEDGDARALECFERALAWVGKPAVGDESREGISVNAWQSLWERYAEAREKVTKKHQEKGRGT